MEGINEYVVDTNVHIHILPHVQYEYPPQLGNQIGKGAARDKNFATMPGSKCPSGW